MFAKLTSMRVLRHAGPGLRPVPVMNVTPAHANDNHASRHGDAGAAGRPVLTCRWVPSATGGLECRWFLADSEATRPDDPGGAVQRARTPVAFGGRPLALVAG
jgi:hypothetical protein